MRIPKVTGVIDRRLLVNYRVDPSVIKAHLPDPFEPELHGGFAVAGICLIRLTKLRPSWLPASMGVGSENAAHRIAVTWTEAGERRRGVYIPRRDTDSKLVHLLGGPVFSSDHHLASFAVYEGGGRYQVTLESRDGSTALSVRARLADKLPESSIFTTLDEASGFFERGSIGYTPSTRRDGFDGLELRCRSWHVEALDVESARSSFFDDETRFPAGAAVLDHALLMRGIEHEWHALDSLCCAEAAM